MKRISLVLLCLSLGFISPAQSVIKIDLDQWKGKKEKTPFDISSIKDNRPTPQRIGTISTGKSKSKEIQFESSSASMIQKFVDKQFNEGNEMNIRLEIERLDIEEISLKKNKKMTAFIFACKFYKTNSQLTEPLYSFNARNSIPKKNALKMAMTNYIGRAITAAILNFKKSYQKYPEWKKENVNAPTVKIDKSVYFNQFESKGDTIALDGIYKLKQADFTGSISEEEKDHAYSFFMITYLLEEVDEPKKISVKIYPKAFFLRSKSWAKKATNTKWRLHQQLLFDLASYHALQFKKAIEKQKLSPGYYKTEINKVYNEISANYFDEMDQLQAETQYGANLVKEELWKKKVDEYLGRL